MPIVYKNTRPLVFIFQMAFKSFAILDRNPFILRTITFSLKNLKMIYIVAMAAPMAKYNNGDLNILDIVLNVVWFCSSCVIKNCILNKKATKDIIATVIVSNIRSRIIVPNNLEKGMLSSFAITPHLHISPARGKAKLTA